MPAAASGGNADDAPGAVYAGQQRLDAEVDVDVAARPDVCGGHPAADLDGERHEPPLGDA